MKLQELRQVFILDRRAQALSPKTMRSYGDITADFISYVGNLDCDELNADHVRTYMGSLYEREGRHGKFSTHSAMKHFQVMRTWLKWAKDQEYISPIMHKLHAPRVSADLPDALLPEEQEALYRYLRESSFRDRLIFDFFLDTGCRLSEVAYLTLDDLHIEDRYAVVRGKGNKEAEVPFGRTLSRDLYVYVHSRRRALSGVMGLFTTDDGNALTLDGMSKLISRTLAKVRTHGKCGAHTLRHTFATNYLRNGSDLESLRICLRHTEIKMTSKYVHLSNVDVRAAHAAHSPGDHRRFR